MGCGLEKDDDQFSWRNKAKGVRQGYCRECKKRYNNTWYENHHDEQAVRVARNRKLRKQSAFEIINAAKQAPCADCGRTFPPIAMDFDHVGGVKVNHVARMVSYSLDKLRAEIAKCEVVCACCHRIRTATRLGLMEKALAS